ncbi:MAG: NUDIX domain-containing protein [Coraliomargarita sp.]|nr:NUDIX domain-containing protein [Coraliomargarita sp.]
MNGYQVGVFPITDDGKVVLVTTRDGDYWILPKGNTEKGRSDRAMARQEAYEEAGIEGVMKRDYLEFRTLGKVKKLRIYPMKVKKLLKNYPERKERERVAVSFDMAERMVEKDLRVIIRKLRKKW